MLDALASGLVGPARVPLSGLGSKASRKIGLRLPTVVDEDPRGMVWSAWIAESGHKRRPSESNYGIEHHSQCKEDWRSGLLLVHTFYLAICYPLSCTITRQQEHIAYASPIFLERQENNM